MSEGLQPIDCIDRTRCPLIERLSSDTVTLLHNSRAHIVRLHRGQEVTDRQVQRAKDAAWDSVFLLAELRRRRF